MTAPLACGPEKRAAFIVNPHAGRGRARKLAAPLPAIARSLGWSVDVHETKNPGDEQQLAAAAKAQGWPVIIAIGGDGTVHGAANGILKEGKAGVTFGHVPIGTGNDFAGTVGLNKAHSPEKNLRLILSGHVRHLDVGRALDEYFVNGLGFGFGADVVRKTLEIDRLSGFPLYLVAVFRTFATFKAPQLRVESSDGSEHGRLLMVEIAIGKTAGGGFRLTPDADPQDGKLDVCVIRNVGWPTFLRYLPKVLRGTHTNLPPVRIFQTDRATVQLPSESVPLHIDGELRYSTTRLVQADIVPGLLPTLCAT